MSDWLKKACFLLLAAVLLVGCSEQKKGDNVLATFEGGSLTVEDVQAHLRKLKKNSRYRNNPELLTPEYAFDHAVNMEMVIAKGLKENLHLDPNIRAEIHGFMANLFLKVMQDRLVPQIDKARFTEEEVKAYFDAHPESYVTPALYDVRIIKAADKAELESLVAELGGGLTFEEAVRTHSTDAATREKGGAVGRRPLKRFRPDWRGIVEKLEPGKVSEPTAIGDSWYLLKLEGKTEPVSHVYEDKKAYVRNDLLYTRYREAWQGTYEKLKKEFSLKIDDVRLQDFVKEGDSK
ncbi:peptidylprolyl cis-trans isomerase PihF, PpiC-type [Syntrophotalea carbinolica DSM 2380]|uniref:Peptidylprolyl cis-trans isomerase PihF, PpiC-type n=1 Tax=Syntrophotalea carbinolica (strain DSM 2380 / NBRC 103641 / GraBd1) TaxID=338963 RepID=Q3A678_SYNC1|nr:peptidyl-prolyl cis-trans isomerase [Syntrophotalea carbinolica]ABA88129.1 peptidylprolyl cis-trans isomerase PihF, PpiC-type [Syntrophotalea carbinolica DSM 2380]